MKATPGPAVDVRAPNRRRAPTAGSSGVVGDTAGWVRGHLGLVVLACVPLAVFGGPALFHLLFLDGDNLIQNYPLRILVGRDLRSGHLPLLNPYLYGGTPLLAGFNAGAASPFNWLYAVVPSAVAWTVNLVLIYEVTLVGTYLMLRRFALSTSAATFGAAAFTFGGYMSGQIVHIDLIGSAAWLPWMLLAVHVITEPLHDQAGPAGPRRRRAWVGVLVLALGLSIVSAGVEAFIDGGTLVAAYAVYRIVSGADRRSSLRAAGSVLVGLGGGLALSAAQWLPGLSFVSQSQRSSPSYAFFGTGSLPVRTVSLLVSPFLLGTNQVHPAYYTGQYNFPEVTSFVGILALIAATTQLAARWRSAPRGPSLRFWYGVLVAGMLAALGTQTPFGYVLYVLPGVNAQRLLNRNLLLVDLALAVLLARFVHGLLERRDEAGPSAGPPGRWAPGRRAETVLTVTPFALAVVATGLLWLFGSRFQLALGAQFAAAAHSIHDLALVVSATTVIAGVTTWLVLNERRFSTAALRRLLAGSMAVDLGFFTLFVLHPPVTPAVSAARTPLAAQLSAATGNGRFVIYDPDQFQDTQLLELGQTDLNVIRRLPSAQGYAALVGAGYYAATGAHYQEDLNPSTLAGTAWDALDTHLLLSLPGYFVTPVAGQSPGVTATQFPLASTQYTGYPTPSVGTVTLAPGHSRTWYFGGLLPTSGGSVPRLGRASTHLRIGLVGATGAVTWLHHATRSGEGTGGAGHPLAFHLPHAIPVAGLVVANPPGHHPSATVGVPTVKTTVDGTVRLDGRLQYAVVPPHWVYVGMIGAFGAFSNTRAKGPAWVAPLGTSRVPSGTAVRARPVTGQGSQRVFVHATGPVRLVRSMAWSRGWHATLVAAPTDVNRGPPAHHPVPVTVTAYGVVQSVAIPGAGNFVVTFTYSGPRTTTGIAFSAVAVTGLVAWLLVEAVQTRRRRRRGQSGASNPIASDARR